MNVIPTGLPGLKIIEPTVFGDARGFFMESWNQARYADADIPTRFVQDNVSFSQRGVLRGLHFQNPNMQGKLVSVLQGEVYDVAVDLRRGSPTFGRWLGVLLSAENRRQLYVPEGFAHGFCVVSDSALFSYKCTDFYAPQFEKCLRWDDPELAITWPMQNVCVSEKDRKGLCLREFGAEQLSKYADGWSACNSASPTLMRHPIGRAGPAILLIGADGQVGFELCRTLQTLGTVHATSRASARIASAIRLDLTDEVGIRSVMRELRPDLIVNAAAYTAVDKAEAEPELAKAVNATGPRILAEEARRLGAALIHYSTDYVFDGTGEHPRSETDLPGPLNVYGRTKLAGEQAIRQTGVPHLILRLSWVYGIHGHNFVKTMLRLGSERPTLRIVADQIGAPTSARVVAEATAQILAQGVSDLPRFLGARGGVIHLACSGLTTWHGFAQAIFATARDLGHPLAVRAVEPIAASEYPAAAQRPLNSRLDCRLVQKRFHITCPSWQSALAQTLADLPIFTNPVYKAA